MLCPFKKRVESFQDPNNGNSGSIESFGECSEFECMAYYTQMEIPMCKILENKIKGV